MDKTIIENAAADAKHIVDSCSVVRAMVACGVIAQQIFLLARFSIEDQIRQGWEVSNPDLIVPPALPATSTQQDPKQSKE